MPEGQGRRPKPTALKLLEGTYRQDRANFAEPKPTLARMIDCPVNLNEKQKLVWDSLAPELIRIGTLTLTDIPAFMRYIDMTLEYNEMQKQIDGKNYFHVVRDENNRVTTVKILPQIRLRNHALNELLRLESHFGMTPASRSRIITILGGEDAKKAGDPFDV